MKRKQRRQEYAQMKGEEEARADDGNNDDEYFRIQKKVEAKREAEQRKREDFERKRKHEEWLQREKEQLDGTKQKQREEERKMLEKEEQERKVRKEWEMKERLEQEESNRIITAKKEKEAMLQAAVSNVEDFNQKEGQHYNPEIHNPEMIHHNLALTNRPDAPEDEDAFGTEWDPRNCTFYMRTGACRFGPRCSRIHLQYESSTTILIPNMFQDVRLTIPMLNERNNESAIEYDEVDLIFEYEKFYDDVIAEFRAAGKVVMFKCAMNYVPHLRGNVYVQYEEKAHAAAAREMFNGRWYDGRQLSVFFSPVHKWATAICGLHDRRLCTRGKSCNFLHVFKNPGNAYTVQLRNDWDPERGFSGTYQTNFNPRGRGYFPGFRGRGRPGYQHYKSRFTNREHYNSMQRNRSERSRSRSCSRSSSRSRSHSRSRDRKSRRTRSRSTSSLSTSTSSSRSRSRSRSRGRTRHRKESKSKKNVRRSHSSSKSRSKSKSRNSKTSTVNKNKTSHKGSSSNDSISSVDLTKDSIKKEEEEAPSETSTDWSDLTDDD